jgi:RNA recognition motif-containing protein
LFEKCGTLFTCSFDMNEFGQYLGTCTLVYRHEKDAAKAIRDYNRATIDGKIMTVEYSDKGKSSPHSAP